MGVGKKKTDRSSRSPGRLPAAPNHSPPSRVFFRAWGKGIEWDPHTGVGMFRVLVARPLMPNPEGGQEGLIGGQPPPFYRSHRLQEGYDRGGGVRKVGLPWCRLVMGFGRQARILSFFCM